MKRRIGLLGGTFDPPHLAHLVVADQARSALGLDEVWLMVAHHPWQKDPAHGGDRVVTPSSMRLEMCHAAVDGAEGLGVSDFEIRLGGETSTARTLEHLAADSPDTEWSVIIGADAAAGLRTWRRADWLAANASFVVADRPGNGNRWPDPPPEFACTRIDVPLIEVSSSGLRQRIAEGRSTAFLIPDPVRSIIDREGLYRSGGPTSIAP